MKVINNMSQKKLEALRKKMNGHIKIELTDKDGNVRTVVDKKNTFTDIGDAHVADQLAEQDEVAMGWMAIGTGDTAFAVGSTVLNSELDRNALAASYPEQGTGGNDNVVTYKATWAAGDGTGAIVEAGIFNSSGAGSMLAASTFSVINKGASDKIMSALGAILNEKLIKFGETLFYSQRQSRAKLKQFAFESVTT